MNTNLNFGWSQRVIAAALVVGLAVSAAFLIAASTEPCCFTNDRYEGTCKVVPGKDETCDSILSYLNNPMSVGKPYCGGTSVRGGWIRVDCRNAKPISKKMQQSAPRGK
jgi:hypothetical protein